MEIKIELTHQITTLEIVITEFLIIETIEFI